MTPAHHHQWDGPVAPIPHRLRLSKGSPDFKNYTCSKCGIDALSVPKDCPPCWGAKK